jgi:hypothetical protein
MEFNPWMVFSAMAPISDGKEGMGAVVAAGYLAGGTS